MKANKKLFSCPFTSCFSLISAVPVFAANGKAKAIRFSTLEKICQVLECQPGDLLTYKNDSNTIPEE
ncbi:helix-turn-helix domain-containing protein [Enterococcus faecium]|uniref:helix-turn-helix domain-containing protein n=1 Tax=Enterococcus faecium TaxID=1352 RepID=UPI003F8B6124